MAQIKLQENLENLYKVRWVLLISFILTFLLENSHIKFLYDPQLSQKFSVFFSDGSLLNLYGSLIGLLLAAFAMIVALMPLFSGESLRRPIFAQVSRLFLFTILDGIMLMILYFTNGLIPDNQSPYFIDVEVFFFFSLLIGLIFCVLTLSDLFDIVRKRGSRNNRGKK